MFLPGLLLIIMGVYFKESSKRYFTHIQSKRQLVPIPASHCFLEDGTDESIKLIASRRETNKYLNLNFKSYLESQVKGNHKLDLQINIHTPYEDKCLQVVDFCCWAIFRRWELQDLSYHALIRNLIIEENPLFP